MVLPPPGWAERVLVAMAVVVGVGVVVHFHTNGANGAFVIYAFRYRAGTACSRSTGTNFRTS